MEVDSCTTLRYLYLIIKKFPDFINWFIILIYSFRNFKRKCVFCNSRLVLLNTCFHSNFDFEIIYTINIIACYGRAIYHLKEKARLLIALIVLHSSIITYLASCLHHMILTNSLPVIDLFLNMHIKWICWLKKLAKRLNCFDHKLMRYFFFFKINDFQFVVEA